MNCNKCGAKRITRRAAGIFSCSHCGVQPGPINLDRGGHSLGLRPHFRADRPAKKIIWTAKAGANQ